MSSIDLISIETGSIGPQWPWAASTSASIQGLLAGAPSAGGAGILARSLFAEGILSS